HWHQIGGRMTLHGALPMVARINAGVLWLGADRGRVENQFGTHQRQCARCLREPLIPADADADAAVAGMPDAKTGIARRKELLLLIAGTVGDMRLAVDAEQTAVGVDDGDAVVVRVV